MRRDPTAPPRRLDRAALRRGVRALTRRDPALARVVGRHGPPPLWARRPGFATLIRIVLEQQVSLASARAVWSRLEDDCGGVTAARIARYDPRRLRGLGLTRQKAEYCREIADRQLAGDLNLVRVARASPGEALRELQAVKGIGPWTADVYLLMALRRPDVWPTGDVALLIALQRLRGQAGRATVRGAARYAARWAPWRSVAARVLWHGYLAGSLKR